MPSAEIKTNASPVLPLEKAQRDARGSIQCLVERPIRSAHLITSKKGAVRAGHYHKTDWHYCYVLSGRIRYSWRPAGSRRAPTRVTVKQGQLFFTPPNTEHWMEFPVRTTFLVLSRNPRDPEAYEKDVVRVSVG